MMKRNAVIMAAGTASRFVPLSSECPKGLLEVKGEILIERQIRQLQEAGIKDIAIVVGYMAEKFRYLQPKYGVTLVMNEDFDVYNNTSSIIRVIEMLDNTFVCSSDNYFPENVFLKETENSYYSALYANGKTNEYCLTVDGEDRITHVNIGGENSWYMVGHVYFNRDFSVKFREIMVREYNNADTRYGYWEDVYIRHIDELPKMSINRYAEGKIQEFDTLDELRLFDETYIRDTRSSIIKDICAKMGCMESELNRFSRVKHEGDHLLFTFEMNTIKFLFDGKTNNIERI